jgi:poly(glycerol-phosphate) alpha-glucosyltransferase
MSPIRHIIYKCHPGQFTGGVQKMVFELALAQRRLGVDVEVWTLDAPREGSAEIFMGLPVRYFHPDKALGFAKSRQMVEAVAALPERSVLHAHNTFHPLNRQVGVAARAYGHRAFYHPHGALSPLWLKGLSLQVLKKRAYIYAIERPNLRAATGVFALTDVERQDLADLGVDAPLHLLPNGIIPVIPSEAAAGQNFRRQHGIPPSASAILYIGRIVPLKKLEDIIGVLSELKYSHPDLHLIIAGKPQDGAGYAKSLQLKVASMGLCERVRWTGFLNEDEKLAAYAASQVFIHASEGEGMSISILEAMSAGLPVVVSRGCNMAEAARAGALVECKAGAAALAVAVCGLLSGGRQVRVQGEAGRAYVGRVHDWASIARDTLRIYAGRA